MKKSVILLHGWTMHGGVFDNFIDLLPPEYDYYAPDLPGHGSARQFTPSLSACVGLLAGLIESSETKPTVIGWSMGAAVAWNYIRERGSNELAGLITLDMSPCIVSSEDWCFGIVDQTPETLREKTQLMTSDWAAAARSISSTMFAKGSDPVPFGRDQAMHHILSEDPEKMLAMWSELLASDTRDVVGDVKCPWLIAFGARSRVYGKGVATWLKDRAPNGQIAEFENSGHSIHLEEPAALASKITGFLQSI